MKNFTLVLLMSIALFSVNINAAVDHTTNGDEPFSIVIDKLFNNSKVSFGVMNATDAKMAYLAMASYNESNDYFSLKTFKKISYIQVYNESGELEYQLPINNSTLHFPLDDYEPGNYEIRILFDGEEGYLSTQMQRK